jgi:hypothetical protein
MRSFGAILVGVLVGALLSVGTDAGMRSAGVFPPLGEVLTNSLLLLATAYRTLYGVLGSYLTARLAPDRPMRHALVLGILGLSVSILGTIVTWNKGPAFGPHWYPITLIVLALPTAWAGGKIRLTQLAHRD